MCTAYFAKSNKVSKSWFEETLAARGLRKGILVNDPRPDYVTQYREGMKSLAGRPVSRGGPLVPRYRSPIDRRTSLLIAGRAGQKVRSTAITLGRAAVASGLYAVQRDDYPVTVMTGHSTAEMILQPTPIDALGVDCPDFVLLTAEEGKQVVRDRLAGLPETAVVCTVPELMPIETRARVEVIPVKELGLDAKKTQTVLASVAWFLARTGMIPLDALDEAATAGTKAEIAQENGATISAVRRQVIPA
jgi:Pyruvate/2-oxoacid:ferredoxin oxidoreductase gamma subunit